MLKFTGRAATVVLGSVLVLMIGFALPARAQDEAQALAEGVRLFEEGKYQAAQEVLVGVDSTKLSADEQKRHSDVLNQVNVALTMSEKAHRDLEDAGLAIDENDPDTARLLLARVVENEYASEAVRSQAAAMLERVGGGGGGEAATAHTQVDVDRAATLTREGDEMRRAGRFDEARRLYNEALSFSAGYPEAVAGLRALDEHDENVAGSRSLPDRIRQQDRLNWQRTETEYREIKDTISNLVSAHRYDEAKQLVLRARQIVEAGRQFAHPASDYENLRNDLDGLESYVLESERVFNEREIERIRAEIEKNRETRRVEAERNREREVESLMKQAMQHRKDGDFEAAIGVLEQVLIIDPRNDTARWLLEDWEDFWIYRQQRMNRDDFYRQSRETLMSVERDKTPWAQDLQYPKNWLEIISREERRIAGEGPLDSLLIGRLDTPINLDLDAVPFRDAVQRFVDAHGINVHVNWNDIVSAGVDPNREITLVLPEQVTLKKAFDMVLAEAGGGGVTLGYSIGDGVMTVATRKFLDHSTQDVFTRIYDIQDLLHEVPDFTDAPTLDVITNGEPTKRDRATRPWEYGDDDDDEPELTPVDRSRVGRLIALIQETVSPDTWRDRGGSIGSIHEMNNQLVVTQNTAGQEQVANLLGQLRTQRAVQIAVEARFLTVQSNYLEELGIDLDIILNSGNAGFDMVSNSNGVIATDPVLGSRLLLPRSFSQLGFLPAAPGIGAPFSGQGPSVPNQPFTQVGLVPQANGGAVNMSNATPIPINSGVMELANAAALSSGVPGTFAGRDVAGLTMFGSFLDNIQVDFLIRATEADSRTTLLTAPKLVLHNGQRAWVAVVTSHAFVSTLQPVVAGNAAAQQPQTQTVNEGAVLDVQGTVSADRRYVTMTLRPGVGRLLALERFQFAGANFISGGGFIQLPQVARQVLNTTVNVPDGGTLLIGGQKLAAEIEVEAGVPVLSKIPVLKRLYSSRSMVKDEQILLILVKPQIIIQSEQERLAFPTLSRRDG